MNISLFITYKYLFIFLVLLKFIELLKVKYFSKSQFCGTLFEFINSHNSLERCLVESFYCQDVQKYICASRILNYNHAKLNDICLSFCGCGTLLVTCITSSDTNAYMRQKINFRICAEY